jgi:hypothetical protein
MTLAIVLLHHIKTHPLTRQQISFNAALSSDRISVEQAFGCVTQLWHANSLDTNLKPLLHPVALHYEISVLFTNIHTFLRGNVVSHRYNIQPPSLDEFLSSLGKENTQNFTLRLLDSLQRWVIAI